MKIAAIVGSTRKESYNLKLAKYIQERYQDKFTLDIVEIGDLPFYNQDTENEPTAEVVEFKKRIKEADAVLWVTPEYNGTITANMKNAIDWLSRVDQVMIGKPSWIAGASMGALGTVKAQAHLRDILFAPGLSSPVLPGNEVLIGAVHEKMDENGDLTDEATIDFLDGVVDNVVQWLEKNYVVTN
ncbi:NAD(P)H-dependent FMN reductase [Alteribacillus persepolensis]|uniref:NAD(P)H-dependent FMN reductase n=1 Tax=Alteribacillus persepolensis TaxID=568899 RepID=A0A1G8JX11_9BACI|nr:NAD(P)H-dependent oxidoreductase [Alteribacillus persepolensis]SDI35734.1 NAD(P)H-dependent FMN reductase [Alteribacillus persepolensis]